MAILADHYARLVESEYGSEWGDCADGASRNGAHRSIDLCIYCGLAP